MPFGVERRIRRALGFEQALQLGRESRRPGRNIPIVIIGGMVIAVVLYLGLRVAFLTALDPASPGHVLFAYRSQERSSADLVASWTGRGTGQGSPKEELRPRRA